MGRRGMLAVGLMVVACGSRSLSAAVEDGDYSVRAYLDRLQEEMGEDGFDPGYGDYEDASVTLSEDRVSLTVGDRVAEGSVARVGPDRWKSQCRGGHYMLNPRERTRAEWFEVDLDAPIALPDVPVDAIRLVVTGQAPCGGVVVETVSLMAEDEDGLQYSLADATRVD